MDRSDMNILRTIDSSSPTQGTIPLFNGESSLTRTVVEMTWFDIQLDSSAKLVTNFEIHTV